MIKDFKQKIEKLAKLDRPKIVIGLYPERMTPSIANGIIKAQKEIADIIVVGRCVEGVECVKAQTTDEIHDKMVSIIKDKKVDGVVRGNVEEHGLLRKLGKLFASNIPENELRIQNPGVMEDIKGNIFALGPSSTAFGRSNEEKILWVDSAIKLLNTFGYFKLKLGFLTSIRKANYKKTTVDNEDVRWAYNTWESAEYLVDYYRKKGFETKNYEIHVEQAADDGCDIICVAEGPIGNGIFRGAVLLGGAKLIAGPRMALGIPYEDDSQSEQDYYPHVLFACAWVNGQKYNKLSK